ncbi:MAG: bifunctional folylpolyglutamate synthase/dihydrofolate synthase [Gammaproteobacteria bacterium]|jgi:dihydrofolate synthase / folylpolyglutamate synthase|nr:bifunctional folylpolyglutamate synthase/dihydrofolate synthase [Gammaproteobacteria bacterium]MBT7370532.1 bifunctional folylpolyglutamate synthase/dihydrofolate synthase [Gammaproteobacteria bacterium]
MTLTEWLDRISAIHPVGWDLGLERVGKIGLALDLLHPADKVVLVAGTNGKGSTCEYLAQIAMSAGLKVGKSTSPHLFRFNERIVVDGDAVDDETIIAAFELIDRARGETTLTYFEFAALASLMIFRQAKVDLAILEVGLGGRLDAMNIVEPDLSIITSVSLDHQSWLGDNREDIGREKAGIMRAGIHCLISDRDPPLSLIDMAMQMAVPIELIGRDFEFDQQSDGRLPRDSFAVARRASEYLSLAVSETELRRIGTETTLPGRLTLLSGHCPILLDVAHNPAAAEHLVTYVESLDVEGDIHAIVGIYEDKDIDGVLAPLVRLVKTWHLTDLDEGRAETAQNLACRLAEHHAGKTSTYAKISEAAKTLESLVSENDLILILGSFPVVAGGLEYFDKSLDRV